MIANKSPTGHHERTPDQTMAGRFSSLTKSVIFHVIIVAVISLSFIWSSQDVTVKETPIQVSFVTEQSNTPQPKKPVEVKDEPPAPPKDDKPQPAPKALEQPKPKPVPIDKKAETKKVEEVKKAEDKPKPVEKAEKPKDKPKPPEPAKKEEVLDKPTENATKDTTTGFASVLKNLADTQPVDTSRDGPSLTESPVVDRMTTGELDSFRQQLSRCWNILPGAAKADSLAVNLTIAVNRDRTVQNVQITDQARYNSDPMFRAAADNAVRAIKHPDCTPLDLPVDKYNTWSTITINFDPKSMF